MGFLSCLAPLLSFCSTSLSSASTATLLEKDAHEFLEGHDGKDEESADRAVDTSARLDALRREMQGAGVDV